MNLIIWSIYRITNLLNNKVYIGQTKDPKTRWSRHKSDAKLNKKTNYHLYDSMRKYGIDNFLFEIIVQTQNIENIDCLEIDCINLYNSTDPNIGYNNSPGGQSNKLVSKSTREKISNSLKGRISPRLGYKLSKDEKQHLSILNTGNTYRLGFKTSLETKNLLSEINTGKIVSLETRQKMSQSMVGKNSGSENGMFGKRSKNAKLSFEQALEIRLEYSLGQFSMLELSKKYNVSKKTILNIVKNKVYVC